MRGGSIHALLGRERRGQIDADQDHHRRLIAPTKANLRLNGTPGPLRRAARGDRRGRRRRAPGAQPHSALLGRREHPAGAARRRSLFARSTTTRSTPRRAAGSMCSNSISIRARRSRNSTSPRCSSSRSPRRCRCARGVLLLDEPTASLTPQEAEVLFRLLRKLRDEGRQPAVRQPQARGSAGNLRRSDGSARRPQRLPEPADRRAVAPGPRAPDDRPQRTNSRPGPPRDHRERADDAGAARRIDRARAFAESI